MGTSIVQLAYSHVNDLVRISNLCFGDGFMQPNYFNTRINSTANDIVMQFDVQIAGFCLSSAIDNETLRTYPIQQPINSNRGAIIKTIAIAPEFQNNGLGSKLIEHLLKFYSGKNFNSIYYPAWLENDKLFFYQKLKSIGFSTIETIPNFWEAASYKEHFICKRCGKPPCKCTMELLKLEI